MTNPTVVRNDANAKMTVTDRIMLALIAKGEQEVHFDLTDFATSIDMERMAFYQGLYRLKNSGALEIIKENTGHGFQQRVVGVRLQRIPTAHEIVTKAINNPMTEARAARATNRTIGKINANVPNVLSYLEKKTIIDNIRAELNEAGFDPAEVLNLPAGNAIAEEACFLYNELCAAQRQIVELETNANLMNRLPAPVEMPLGEPVLA